MNAKQVSSRARGVTIGETHLLRANLSNGPTPNNNLGKLGKDEAVAQATGEQANPTL